MNDEKAPENLSDKEMTMVKDREGIAILSKIKDGAYVVALAIDGRSMSSEDLAEHMSRLSLTGVSHIYLVIGGSLGPVSYTHLRAHETRHDLVCRLLLEKKKN